LVIRWWGKNKFRMNKWLCRCKCGKQSICLGQQLKNKRVQSCGCKARERYRDMLEDLTGKRFGSLTVLHRIKTNFSHPIWKCVCDCGEETNVAASNLRSHSIKSCGCYRKKRMSTIASKYHGASHPQYKFQTLRTKKENKTQCS